MLVQREEQLAHVAKDLEAFKDKARPEILARLKTAALAEGKSKLDLFDDRVRQLGDLQLAVKKDIDSLSARLKEANLGQVDLESLRVEMAQTEKTADRVNQEMETMRVELDTPSRISVFEPATVMLGIEGYRRLKYSLMAGLGTLLLGLGLITVLEARNRRILTTDEASGELGLKLIGTVPSMPRTTARAYTAGATRPRCGSRCWRRPLMPPA